MKRRLLERVLNKSLTRDLHDFIEITEARKEDRNELMRTILSGIAMITVLTALFLTALFIEQPDVPSKPTAAGEVRV